VARQQDRGDLWELYRGLDGGSKIAMTNRQEVPRSGRARFSDEFKGEPGSLRTGPVFSGFHVAHPFDTGRYESIVRIYADLRRIECDLRLVNNEKFVSIYILSVCNPLVNRARPTHQIGHELIQPSGQ